MKTRMLAIVFSPLLALHAATPNSATTGDVGPDGIVAVGSTVNVYKFPDESKKAGLKVGMIEVGPSEDGKKTEADINIILLNEGSGPAVVNKVVLTTVAYKNDTAIFGGDGVLSASVERLIDLSDMREEGAKMVLPNTWIESIPKRADRILISARASHRDNTSGRTTSTWILKASIHTTEGILESGAFKVQIPNNLEPRR